MKKRIILASVVVLLFLSAVGVYKYIQENNEQKAESVLTDKNGMTVEPSDDTETNFGH